MTVTGGAVFFVLQLWRASPRVPFAYAGDANVNATIIKGIIETGWYQRIPSLGAPAGYDMHDFPLGGDNLQLLLIKGLTFLTHDWALVANTYYLLTFALVSAVTYLVFRRLSLGRGLSLGLATVFSLLPYHFIPGQAHLLLSGYLVVPLGALLVLTVFDGGFLRRTKARGEPRPPRWRRWAVPAALCVLIGSGGSYYAFFIVLLLGVAGVMAFLVRSSRPGAVHAAVLMGLILVVGAVNNVPSLLYWHAHGRNPYVAQRALGESDLYALHVVDLILPVEHHRLKPLADLKAKRDKAALSPILAAAPNSPLGLAATAGLALSLLGAGALAVNDGFASHLGPARRRLAQLGVLNAVAMLFASIGGFSLLVAMAGFLQIRVWARMTVFIGFFSLLALGLVATAGADVARRRLAARADHDVVLPRVRRAGWIAAPLLLALAVLDQTTPAMVPAYAATRDSFTSDRAFVQQIERTMPTGTAVFQLPIISYPERPPVVQMSDYDLFRGYLHSTRLRWSYGAMRGRPGDWTPDLAGRPVGEVLDRVTAAGFEGLYVDRFGFVDQGHELETQLVALLGPPSVVSRDGRLSFYDLRAHATAERERLGPEATAALGRLVLHPVVTTWAKGFGALTFSPPYSGSDDAGYYPKLAGQTSSREAAPAATLELQNRLQTRRPVRLSFAAASSTGNPGELRVGAGTTPLTFPLSATPAPVEVPLDLPPGTTTVTFRSTALAGPGTPSFRIDNFHVDDSGVPPGPPRS